MKNIVVSFFVVLILVVVGSYFYQANKAKPIDEVTTKEPVTMKEESILLYPESGDVSFKVTPDADFQVATTSPTSIPNKTIVHTGVGKASILLPDNSILSLDNNTEVTVNYGDQGTSIYQSLGSTYHRVQALLTGKTYQVQTAGTLAAVRGTKFAVTYDAKVKKTKVAVTEHAVEVSTIPKATGTGAVPKPEVMTLEEGKMVSVVDEIKTTTTGTPVSQMVVTDTEKDKEMNAFINEEMKVDEKMDSLMKTTPNQGDLRNEIKRSMFNDEGDVPKTIDVTIPVKETTVESPKTEVRTTTETPKTTTVTPVRTTTQPSPKTEATVTNTTVVKMDEETFFNQFEPMFIRYFYVDDTPDSACDQKVTPEQRVSTVATFAKNNGYPFTTTSLLSFAQAIDAYCKNKDDSTKERLQSRFNDEYPFNEAI